MAIGADKAAILLSRMPPEVVEVVLANIDPALAGGVRARLQQFQKTPPAAQELEQTLAEMRALLNAARTQPTASGKKDALADEFVRSGAPAPSPETPKAPDPKPPAASEPPPKTTEIDPAVALAALGPALLASALRDERVPVAAVVLGCLPDAQMGEVMKLLPKEMRRDLALTLGQTPNRSPELVRTLARAVVAKAGAVADRPAELDEDARIKKLADLLRRLEREDRKDILDSLLAKDPTAADKVKKLIYLFEDLVRVENRSLQALLSEVDMKTLARAMRGIDEALKSKILSNLSKRAGETLEEELALLTSLPQATVREAQATIVDIMQRLDKDGKLVMLE